MFQSVVQKVHFVDMFVNVSVPAVPSLIGQLVFNSVKPVFGRSVNGALIHIRQRGFHGDIFVGAGVGKHIIDLPIIYHIYNEFILIIGTFQYSITLAATVIC